MTVAGSCRRWMEAGRFAERIEAHCCSPGTERPRRGLGGTPSLRRGQLAVRRSRRVHRINSHRTRLPDSGSLFLLSGFRRGDHHRGVRFPDHYGHYDSGKLRTIGDFRRSRCGDLSRCLDLGVRLRPKLQSSKMVLWLSLNELKIKRTIE